MSDFTACKECINRYPGCHGKCAEYLAEKAIHDELTAGERALHHNSMATTEGRKIRSAAWDKMSIKKMGGYCK